MNGLLDEFGSLVWRHLPEAREAVRELVDSELERALHSDAAPEQVAASEYAVHAVNPLFIGKLGYEPLDPELIRRFAQFCRAVLDYDGPEKAHVEDVLQMTILDAVDDPQAAAAVAAVDPELVTLVQERLNAWL
jgi:hypothetical protein